MMRNRTRASALPLAVAFLLLAPAASAVTIDWVTVGDPANACATRPQGCFGAVDYEYRIGKYEVTNAQYAEFLNGVDQTGANTLGLYNSGMESDTTNGGISFVTGNAEGSKHVVKIGMANKPVPYVDWYSSLRFANWLHNGH